MFCLIPCCIGTLLGCAIGAVVSKSMSDAEEKKKHEEDSPAIAAIMRETDEMIREHGGWEGYARYMNSEMERGGESWAGYQGSQAYNGRPPAYTAQQHNRPPVNTYRGERFYE